MKAAMERWTREAGYRSFEDFLTWQTGHDLYWSMRVYPAGIMLPWWLGVLAIRWIKLPFKVALARLRASARAER